MIPTGVRVWLATGHTDMRCGYNKLALRVQELLGKDPNNGQIFVFRGRRGHLIKVIWYDGQGACLFTKRLERGRFISYGLCQWFYACFSDRPFGRQRGDAHNPNR
jgi:transposase